MSEERRDMSHIYRQLNFSKKTELLVEAIRSSGPSRAVGSGKSNVRGRYPSRKMGMTIQFESHRNELPAIFELEHDQEVIEYYDQPLPIAIEYQGTNKRRIRVLHTPDFFVIREEARRVFASMQGDGANSFEADDPRSPDEASAPVLAVETQERSGGQSDSTERHERRRTVYGRF